MYQILTQKFPCKEKGCDQEAVYEYKPVDVFGYMSSSNTRTDRPALRKATVTLSCPKGHSYEYEVIK
jgi:hypothetical protein